MIAGDGRNFRCCGCSHSQSGGQLLEAQFLIELEFLHGRKQLEPTPVISFLKY